MGKPEKKTKKMLVDVSFVCLSDACEEKTEETFWFEKQFAKNTGGALRGVKIKTKKNSMCK